jgi:hypothetical protein
MNQVFLLSPAFCGGRRAALLLSPRSTFDIAERLKTGSLTLGEAFSFLSGLYFRGKLAYGERFGRVGGGGLATFVITPTQGLRPPSSVVTADELREFASVDVDAGDRRYREPLERDLARLDERLDPHTRVILLGSIATPKYVDALLAVVASRLHYPPSFIGRGDMSRGGLLLRAARSGVELDYTLLTAMSTRRGPRPPRLEPLPRPGVAARASRS